MQTEKCDFGMIGLGTMGRNLVYNMCDHGYKIAGFDKDAAKVDSLGNEADGRKVSAAHTLEDFIRSLKTPKVIMLLVPAGKAVDSVIDELKPYLLKDDLLIDCGNSHFTDTDRRIATLAKDDMQFMGVGISGGESGARNGPSIMPGGNEKAYELVKPLFEAIAAKVNGAPCVTWLGPGSAGHYVKMVHNGIEYALMQLLAEAYHMLKECLQLNNDQLHKIFSYWNEGRLKSYLVEISASVFLQEDDLTGKRLLDMILDSSKQNGTGQWTSQNAMELHVPVPNIDIACSMRDISGFKKQRVDSEFILNWHKVDFREKDGELIDWVENAVYFSMIISYAQGMALLNGASEKYGYGLKPESIAGIWRGGCIIRAALLDDILKAYSQDASLVNLMLSKDIAMKLQNCQDSMRLAVKTGIETGIPLPVMMSSLSYFDSFRRGWLPANLIQAQRDYFGAHTYERTDRAGSFHTQWKQENSL